MKPILRKTLAVLPLAAACAAAGSFAQAQTVNISGKVLDITCTPTIVGGNTINLPVASPSDMPSVGNTAHSTLFTISLTGCGSDANGLTARAMFYSTTAGSVSNSRLNLASGSTGSGWQYQFTTGASSAITIPVRTNATVVGQTNDAGATVTGGAANVNYRVRYYRSAALVKGTGVASANFVLYYM